jgi:hypothetical protein
MVTICVYMRVCSSRKNMLTHYNVDAGSREASGEFNNKQTMEQYKK